MNPTVRQALAQARQIGRDHGRNAAEWVLQDTIGGRAPAHSTREAAERLLTGIRDGDPMVLDTLPHPDLSGQQADGYTPRQLLADCDGNDGDASFHDGLVQDLCDNYEAAFELACQDAIERACLAAIALDRVRT